MLGGRKSRHQRWPNSPTPTWISLRAMALRGLPRGDERLRLGRAMRVVPQMADALLAGERRLEEHRLHLALDVGEIVGMAHADRDAIAGLDRHLSLVDHHRAAAFEDHPVLVA